jgi:DNA-binding PadR family transcriptional regulator
VSVEERLKRPFGDIWHPHRGTISNALKELEDRGFVERREPSEGMRGRTSFQLTAKGRKVLEKAFKGFSHSMEITSRFVEVLSHEFSRFSELDDLIQRCVSEANPRNMLMLRLCIPREKMLSDERAVQTYHRFLRSELKQIEENLEHRRRRGVRINVE